MAAYFDGTDVHLFGVIGFDLFEDSFTHGDALYAFAEAGRDRNLTVYLNSPGGDVGDGEAIANLIKARTGKTTVVVAGLAMSAATIIACAADECVMSDGSLYMVHEPNVSLFFADSEGLKSAANIQRLATASYADIYAKKTGKSVSEVRTLMKATTYYGADEAVAARFADRKSADVVNFATAAPAFAYADTRLFANAPKALTARAIENDWRLGAQKPPEKPKDTPMSNDKTAATAQATATARIKAIMKAPEADGRKDLAEHLAFDTEMTADAALAIMKAAPQAHDHEEEDRPPHGVGLGVGHGGYGERLNARSGGGLVAAMKQKHGVQ